MPERRRKKINISVFMLFTVFVLFFSVMIWQKYRSSYEAPVIPPLSSSENNRSITLFFSGEGTRLSREAREIGPCGNDGDCLKSVLEELLNGPVGEFEEAIPDGTVVSSIRIDGDQATIEFNNLFFEAMPSGSSAEMLAVYSVVNTVAVNFPRIQKVKISGEGGGAGSLRHLDISDPLIPDYTLEQMNN